MKSLIKFIKESYINFDYKYEECYDDLNNMIDYCINIYGVDDYEQLGGLNCWDLTWCFSSYAKRILNYKDDVECIIFGKGSHYCPMLTTKNGTKYIIDFTAPLQKHFDEVTTKYKKNIKTNDNLPETKIILAKDIHSIINNIEIENESDLDDLFNEIFSKV